MPRIKDMGMRGIQYSYTPHIHNHFMRGTYLMLPRIITFSMRGGYLYLRVLRIHISCICGVCKVLVLAAHKMIVDARCFYGSFDPKPTLNHLLN